MKLWAEAKVSVRLVSIQRYADGNGNEYLVAEVEVTKPDSQPIRRTLQVDDEIHASAKLELTVPDVQGVETGVDFT